MAKRTKKDVEKEFDQAVIDRFTSEPGGFKFMTEEEYNRAVKEGPKKGNKPAKRRK